MTDIFELICRTCLKATEQSYNIFNHSTNNNLISDLIMDCTPMRVAVDDGFPTNACNDCIDKLNSIYDFKTMVMESDIKLHQLYRNKIDVTSYDCGDQRTDTPATIKSELNLSELVSGNSDPNGNESVSGDPLDLDNVPIEQDDCDMEHNSDNQFISNDSIVVFEDITKEEPSIQPELNPDSGEVQTESAIENVESNGMISTEARKTRKYRKYRKSANNVNEQQVELLNNADYNRIMSMGLTKKQKNRMTIYCPDCKKTFTFRYFVDLHAHIHTGNLPFKCEKCDKRFSKNVLLKMHMRCHIETKDFQCEECGKAFKSIILLRVHRKKHSTERPYKCHLCPQAFKLKSVLQGHIKRHAPKEKKYVCEICGESCPDTTAMYKHKTYKHGPKRVKPRVPCEICGKAYANKRGLQIHVANRHADKRPYVCEECGRSFFDMPTLKQHTFIHTGEKPFSCELCGKKFRQKACVFQHMRIHTGVTPYPCKFCSARFKHSHHLRGHVKAHHKDQVEK